MLQFGLWSALSHLKSSTWSHWFSSSLSASVTWKLVSQQTKLGLQEKPYICCGKRCKSHSSAILDDGMTIAVEINIDIAALMNTDLSGNHDKNAIGYTCDMDRAVYATGND